MKVKVEAIVSSAEKPSKAESLVLSDAGENRHSGILTGQKRPSRHCENFSREIVLRPLVRMFACM